MNDILEQVKRFQDLKNITGTHKCSSYSLNFSFDVFCDTVIIEWGCYDVGGYPRHYETACDHSDVYNHMRSEIDNMVIAIAESELNKELE